MNVKGLGEVNVQELVALTQTYLVSAEPFTIPNPMTLRRARAEFLRRALHKTVVCVCEEDDKIRDRFVRFFGFKELDRGGGIVRYLKVAEPYA